MTTKKGRGKIRTFAASRAALAASAARLRGAELPVQMLDILAAAQLGPRPQQRRRPRRDAIAHRIGDIPASRPRATSIPASMLSPAPTLPAASTGAAANRRHPVRSRKQRAVGPQRDDQHLAAPVGDDGPRGFFEDGVAGNWRPV